MQRDPHIDTLVKMLQLNQKEKQQDKNKSSCTRELQKV